MRAVILAGGRGTRLAPYTTVLPKPLVPMGDRPILELMIRQLYHEGFRTIDLCMGHLGELIHVYLSEGVRLPDELDLRYHWEQEPLGTAGPLRTIEGLDVPFLAMNGDILTDLSYASLMHAHEEGGAALTIASHRRDIHIDLGVIEGDGDRVTRYVEKPTMDFQVSMGIYAYSPSAVRHIPDGPFDFPEVVDALIAAGERVAIHPHRGTWFDIGTPADHEQALAEIRRSPGLYYR
jgi:NDP-sugar pyrophosphorylase family protein